MRRERHAAIRAQPRTHRSLRRYRRGNRIIVQSTDELPDLIGAREALYTECSLACRGQALVDGECHHVIDLQAETNQPSGCQHAAR